MELEAMSRYTSPVNPAVFPHLTVVLLAIGMFFTAWFFVYESSSCCSGLASTCELPRVPARQLHQITAFVN
ncbi:Transmembrane protein 258 [Manis javanica]|nr:Transmembrane protein 258 [Manis javanica]